MITFSLVKELYHLCCRKPRKPKYKRSDFIRDSSLPKFTVSSTLYEASAKNDVFLVERALAHEFGVIVKEEVDQALHRASALGHYDVAELLIEHGADVNAEGETDGDSALCVAAQNNHYRVVKLLLKHGSDINLQSTKQEQTALHLAASTGRAIIAKSLIRAGCDLDLKDYMG